VFCPVLCLLAFLIPSCVQWLVGTSLVVFLVFHPGSGLPGGIIRLSGVLSGCCGSTVFALFTCGITL
jgi:hypothetical protein